jgi:hypothetical protein
LFYYDVKSTKGSYCSDTKVLLACFLSFFSSLRFGPTKEMDDAQTHIEWPRVMHVLGLLSLMDVRDPKHA